MSRTHDTVEAATQIIAWRIKHCERKFAFVPGSDATKRAVRRARQLCALGVSAEDAATQALNEIEKQEIAVIAMTIEAAARKIARRFKLEINELTNESLVRVLPSLAKNFVPPLRTAGVAAFNDCLRAYLRTPVYRTALALRFTRRRRVYNINEEVLDQIGSDLATVSEIEMHDEHAALHKKLESWLLSDPDRLRRLEAISESKNLVTAAKGLGVSDAALRQWLLQLRKRVRRMMPD